jgi:hypothetical protein
MLSQLYLMQGKKIRPFSLQSGRRKTLQGLAMEDGRRQLAVRSRAGARLPPDLFNFGEGSMQTRVLLFGTIVLGSLFGSQLLNPSPVEAGDTFDSPGYKVLAPIRHGNLTVFPVVAAKTYDTSEFITLDEGIKSGDVVVTEYGNTGGMVRRPGGVAPYQSARVNTLELINNSKRPLILLAGEIVTGGKQDRVIGKDRLVPAESDPIDLSVFCVEHGRWVASSDKFGTMSMNMAAPSVRGSAMASQNQQMVWDSVGRAKEAVVAAAPAPAAAEGSGTTSYAKVMDNADIKQQVDEVAKPVEENYSSTIKQLRDRHAVGVVVAVNGQFVWADLFASTSLLEKYWPKLVRSYATEAVVSRAKGATATESGAQTFLDHLDGRHETIDREPGLYRHTEVTGDGFKAFELTSLLPKTDFPLHIAKMVE